MVDAKFFFYNESLRDFINSINLNLKQKKRLILKISQLDLGERISLFKTLNKVYLLDIRKEEAKEKIKKFWEE